MSSEHVDVKTHVKACKTCGKDFLVIRRRGDKLKEANYCPLCRKEYREKKKKEKQEKEDQERALERHKKLLVFEKELPNWDVKEISDIKPIPRKTLYIIGNGFDLMHGVESSYYSFADYLAKKNKRIIDTLEFVFTPEDIWADFEESLASFDAGKMASRTVVDTFLDISEAYEEDSPMANFYMAVEDAAQPMRTVAYELPKEFRKWVGKLAVQTYDRPLANLFVGGKVLDFNYTEFVESLYGVSEEDVCYIHGCTKKVKGKSDNKLVLGHREGASETSYSLDEKAKKVKTYRQYLTQVAQERVFDIIIECDQELTKNCKDIIKNHEDFFSSLKEMKDIVVIGHSLSEVDVPYFRKIVEEAEKGLHWYIGLHGLRDLENLENLIKAIGLNKKDITIFRTDKIHVDLIPTPAKPAPKIKEKTLTVSKDRKWKAKKRELEFSVVSAADESICCRLIIPDGIRRATIDSEAEHLFLVDNSSRLFLFARKDDKWNFVGELVFREYQNVLNKRLNKVFKNDETIIFVYNNRTIKFSLVDGSLLYNKSEHHAKNHEYPMYDDVTRMFLS